MYHEMNALMVQNGIEYAKGDVSGASLDPAFVCQARDLETKCFNNMGVYDRVPRSQSRGELIQTRWIDINKGDISCQNYRSGLVGKESKTHANDILYMRQPHRSRRCD